MCWARRAKFVIKIADIKEQAAKLKLPQIEYYYFLNFTEIFINLYRISFIFAMNLLA